MKKLLLALASVLLSVVSFAQTTFTIVGPTETGRLQTGSYSVFALQMSDQTPFVADLSIDQLRIGEGPTGPFHCADQSPPFLGFVFYTITGNSQTPCTPAIMADFGPLVTDATTIGTRTFYCTGPSSLHAVFADGTTFDSTMSYHYAQAGRFAGCFTTTESAVFIVPYAGCTVRDREHEHERK
jgi:hypothetical protein